MASQEKIDLFKQYKSEYVQAKTPTLVTVSEAWYLSITGQGTPGGPEFEDRIGAMYGMAYTIKMTRKFAGLQDYTVGKLECQWWVDGPTEDLATVPQDQWHWKTMIRTPHFVFPEDLGQAVAKLLEKGKPASVREVVFESIAEGQCVQMLHIGPYDQEGQTIEKMKAFAVEQGLQCHGRHHEIYLSDPRRIPPERLKTILRQPVGAGLRTGH